MILNFWREFQLSNLPNLLNFIPFDNNIHTFFKTIQWIYYINVLYDVGIHKIDLTTPRQQKVFHSRKIHKIRA